MNRWGPAGLVVFLALAWGVLALPSPRGRDGLVHLSGDPSYITDEERAGTSDVADGGVPAEAWLADGGVSVVDAIRHIASFADEQMTQMPGWPAYQECRAANGAEACTEQYNLCTWQLLARRFGDNDALRRFDLAAYVGADPRSARDALLDAYAVSSHAARTALLMLYRRSGPDALPLPDELIAAGLDGSSIPESVELLQVGANQPVGGELAQAIALHIANDSYDSRLRARGLEALGRPAHAAELNRLSAMWHDDEIDLSGQWNPLYRALTGCGSACSDSLGLLVDDEREDRAMTGLRVALLTAHTSIDPSLERSVERLRAVGTPDEQELATQVLRRWAEEGR